MTESLKFTSPAPAPVSGVLACASREAGAENNLKLARAIVVEVADHGADQHVKIKVGTLLALALGLEGIMKVMASLEDDRDSKIKALSEWEVFGIEMLEQKFKCLPGAEGRLKVKDTVDVEAARKSAVETVQNDAEKRRAATSAAKAAEAEAAGSAEETGEEA